MTNLLPVASGKGGVGKSTLAVNLSILLAQRQKKVILADFDLGGANLHTMLGLKNNHAGLGNFIYHQTDGLSSLLQETGVENLQFIAGDCLFPGTPNLDFATKRRIITGLKALDADYVILDLSGGTTYNTLDFFLLTYNSILVTTPELTSVLNAYAFLKAAVFRFFLRQYKLKSPERIEIDDFLKKSISGVETSFQDLVEIITGKFPDSAEKVRNELSKYQPQVIVNMGKMAQDIEIAQHLRALVQKKLGITITFIGFIPNDPDAGMAIAKRTPLILLKQESAFVQALNATGNRICHHEYAEIESLESSTEATQNDLNILTKEFSETNGIQHI
jgi:flagellar biosynthesis protein FlhG